MNSSTYTINFASKFGQIFLQGFALAKMSKQIWIIYIRIQFSLNVPFVFVCFFVLISLAMLFSCHFQLMLFSCQIDIYQHFCISKTIKMLQNINAWHRFYCTTLAISNMFIMVPIRTTIRKQIYKHIGEL